MLGAFKNPTLNIRSCMIFQRDGKGFRGVGKVVPSHHLNSPWLQGVSLKKGKKKRKWPVPKNLPNCFHWEFCTGKYRTLLLAATSCRLQILSSSGVRWVGRQFLYAICKVSSANWNYAVNVTCPRGTQSQCSQLKRWLAESFKPWEYGDVSKIGGCTLLHPSEMPVQIISGCLNTGRILRQ